MCIPEQLEPHIPRYKMIASHIMEAIRSSRLGEGTKLPPHRLLADRLGVTVGTVSKAYAELEKHGLVSARVGDGTYVRGHDHEDRGYFRAVTNGAQDVVDFSLNTHISMGEVSLLADTLAQLAAQTWHLHGVLQYQPDSGSLPHRQSGLRWLARSGVDGSPENVVVTNGAQHALLCALMATTRPGDAIGAEVLSYPGLFAAARYLGLRLRGMPIDEEGIVPEALEEACALGVVRVVFCTPTLHNPTTATMSLERRAQIARLARRHNLILIEDDVHGTLVTDHPPPLHCYAPERTIFISSLTKAVASGLRVGYMLVPAELRQKVALAVRASCWMATPLVAEVASRWIDDGTVDQLIRQQQEEIRRRKALVADLLAPLDVRSHPDSLHFWILPPEPWRSDELAEELRHAGVLVKSADAFAIGRHEIPHAIRASVSGGDSDQILVDGFRIIRDMLVVGL
jgi:DNA-binding transcriptional MocR family regulator